MRTIVSVIILLLLNAAQCSVPFNSAYRQMSAYITAQIAEQTAREALTNAEKDPALPPLAVTLARQRYQAAQNNTYYAVLSAKASQMALYATVLQILDQLDIDNVNITLNELAVQVATIRQQNATITIPEMATITDDLARAKVEADNTQGQLTIALAKLEAISAEPAAQRLTPPTPAMDLLHTDGLPSLVDAKVQVTAAQTAVTLAQGSDSAPIDLQARERELHLAQDNAKAVDAQLSLALDNAKAQYRYAAAMLDFNVQSLTTAQNAFTVLSTTYKNGLVSKMVYLGGQMNVDRSILARDTALMNLWQAYYSLLSSAGPLPN